MTSVRLPALAAAIAAVAALATVSIFGDQAAASTGGVETATSSDGGDDRSGDWDAGQYDRLWDRVSRRDKRWARETSECESGGDPDAIGGGGLYRGAFQFRKSTWRRSPKSPGGDPIEYPYRTQAVVAVFLKNRDGTAHWPVCG